MNPQTKGPHVIVGVDASATSLQAVRWAAEYVRRYNGTLELVAAWHFPASYGLQIGVQGFYPEEDARILIERSVKESGLPDGQVVSTLIPGAAAGILVTASMRADLLVVGCRGLTGLNQVLLGSTSTHCVHHAACPVLVFRPTIDE